MLPLETLLCTTFRKRNYLFFVGSHPCQEISFIYIVFEKNSQYLGKGNELALRFVHSLCSARVPFGFKGNSREEDFRDRVGMG